MLNLKAELENVFHENRDLLLKLRYQIDLTINLTPETSNEDQNDYDTYFDNNRNFFTKSFIVLSCSYLEFYLKETLKLLLREYNDRLTIAKIPNFLIQHINQKKILTATNIQVQDGIGNLRIDLNDEQIDSLISPNIHKTIHAFRIFGVDLEDVFVTTNVFEEIGLFVEKRNNIVHYNDSASEITLPDVANKISRIIEYIELIYNQAISRF